MLGTTASLLEAFADRLGRKTHLRLITAGWERRVGIVVEDRQEQLCLTFYERGVECTEWHETLPADLVVRGQERDLLMLFSGEELVYLRAKQAVSVKGPLRDQLKMDALLRLAW
jgi:hypothetical protein